MKESPAETQRRREEEGKELPSVEILGVRIHRVDFAQTLAQIAAWIEEHHAARSTQHAARTTHHAPRTTHHAPRTTHHAPRTTHQLCTVNPEFVMEARRDPAFAAVLGRADLCAPDGVGILWAGRLLGHPFAERVTGSDGIYRICARAAGPGWRIYLLGAAPGVAEQAAIELVMLNPRLRIVGVHSGSPSDADWPEIQERLIATRPEILFVAFGHPRQDLWIDAHRHELPVAVALGVGGAFDFVAGVARRAPLWMQRLGLEWLHRLVVEPWRWRRMRVLPVFVALVVGQWIQQRRNKIR